MRVIEVITQGPQGPAGPPGSIPSGSFLTTASISDATITLVKGDSSSFDLTVNNVSNSLSSSYALTASYYGGSVTSASYATTSSYANNFTVQGTLILNGTLTDQATVLSTIVGSNNLFTQATGSRTSAFGKYTLYNGANARAGELMIVWNGTITTYTDISTTDIGDTSDITFNSIIVGSNIQIDAIAGSSGWTIKMLTTFI